MGFQYYHEKREFLKKFVFIELDSYFRVFGGTNSRYTQYQLKFLKFNCRIAHKLQEN